MLNGLEERLETEFLLYMRKLLRDELLIKTVKLVIKTLLIIKSIMEPSSRFQHKEGITKGA